MQSKEEEDTHSSFSLRGKRKGRQWVPEKDRRLRPQGDTLLVFSADGINLRDLSFLGLVPEHGR